MTAPHTELDGVVLEFITRDDAVEMLDRQARKFLNMSGLEFARAYCAGELDAEENDVIRVHFLLGMAGIECGVEPNAE
jgi:hypothetical protein